MSNVSTSEFVIVRGAAWEGLYIGGVLVVEGIQLSSVDVLTAVAIKTDGGAAIKFGSSERAALFRAILAM